MTDAFMETATKDTTSRTVAFSPSNLTQVLLEPTIPTLRRQRAARRRRKRPSVRGGDGVHGQRPHGSWPRPGLRSSWQRSPRLGWRK